MTAEYTFPTAGVLRPSSAPRWGHCAGSFALETRYPEDEQSPEAREGTAAHWWVSEALLGRVHPVGTVTPNGHPVDEEMTECGQVYLDEVAPLAGVRAVEQPVTMRVLIHPANEGTPDLVIVDWPSHTIHLPDFKYGQLYVEPFENLQLIDYLAGVVERLELTCDDFKGWRVRLGIIQPRNFHYSGPVRWWERMGWQIWPYFDQLAQAAILAKQPNAPTITGAWCRDCNGRWACEAFLRSADASQEMAGESIPLEMSPAALGLKLRHIVKARKRLESLELALKEVALGMMQRGQRVPHWTKGYGKGKEKWVQPLPEVFALGDMFGVDLRKEAAITPAQARKAGIDETVIAAYAEAPHGAAKLVPDEDNAAAKAFSK